MDSPARLLAAVADALNACERAGITLDLAHGAVWTRYGYVLPMGDPRLGNRWAARMKPLPVASRVTEMREQSGNWTVHRCRAADDADLTAEQEIVLGMLRKETAAMSEQPGGGRDPDPEVIVALEPETVPGHPLRAQDAEALIEKDIALWISATRCA